MAFARTVTNASYRYVAAVQDAAKDAQNTVEYAGGGLGRDLSVVARLIRGGLGTRLFLVSQGGFDTHSMQGAGEGRHAGLMGSLAGGVSSFLEDLKSDGLDERVVVMTFSEFGRTLDENGSQGTDHGASAPLFLFGKGLTPGLYGTPNPLKRDNDFYGGDPAFTTDYRQVYATLLEHRLVRTQPQRRRRVLPARVRPHGLPLGHVDLGAHRSAGARAEPVGRAQPGALGSRRHVRNGLARTCAHRPVRRAGPPHCRPRIRLIRGWPTSHSVGCIGFGVRSLPSPPRHRFRVDYAGRNRSAVTLSCFLPSPFGRCEEPKTRPPRRVAAIQCSSSAIYFRVGQHARRPSLFL